VKSDLRRWLAAYPGISRISTLAIDALSCGLLDAESALARAVMLDMRLAAGLREYHQRAAHGFATRRNRLAIRIEGGVAVLNGSIAAGVAISQTRQTAVLYLSASLPETVIASLPGHPVADVVDGALLRRRDYMITNAEQHSHGLSVSFDVPSRSMPLQDVLRAAGSGAG
jgi:hypothetical protein